MSHRISGLLACTLAGLLLTAGAAAAVPTNPEPSSDSARSATLSLGPVTFAGVPLSVCANTSCQATPSVTQAAMQLAATAATGATAPDLVAAPCPSGVGIAAKATGTAGGRVTGTLILVLAGGVRVSLPVDQSIPASGVLTLSACTGGS